jgi:hypothetical protein
LLPQACLDLLELKSTGIFAMIDEEINVPKGSDEGFKSKLMAKHGKVLGPAHSAAASSPPLSFCLDLFACFISPTPSA